jgi:hypothetical protein
MTNPFKVGDIIRYKNGDYNIRVERVADVRVSGSYIHSDSGVTLRHHSHFRLIMTKDNTKDTTMTTKLYEVTTDGVTKYATKLATNSEGLWVLEESGTNLIFTAKAVDCQKVMPHTVSIKFLTGDLRQESNLHSGNYNYFAKKGSVSVGDFVFVHNTSGLATVTGVDTKSEQACKELVGYIMAATKIESS